MIIVGLQRLERSGRQLMSTQEPTTRLVLRPRAAGTTLYCWLYEEIRTAILEGRLSPGLKLPSRKALARQYRVSLTTVLAASDRLIKLGYLDAREGDGTYVSDAIPPDPPGGVALAAPGPARAPRRVLSARGRLLAAHPFPKVSSPDSNQTFGLDRPALDTFPIELWNRLAARRIRGGRNLELLGHGEPLGFPPLRAALADYVGRTRGARCEPDQVVVTSGTQDSLDLVARLLLDPGDQVWMEDPGYAPAASLLRSHGARVFGVPVDADGMNCDAGRRRCPLARLAYVTPARHFPLGVPMSRERRLKLLQWAHEAGAWIFEDDHDGQLPCDGPLPCDGWQALHAEDRAGSVIYATSFNRFLFSSLRLGFLILPPAFIEAAAAALSITRRYQPMLGQAVLTDFMAQGHLDRHTGRLRELYSDRRDVLVRFGRTELGDLMRFSDSRGGWQVVGWLAEDLNEAEAWRRAAARQIDSIALGSLTLERRMPPGLVFGIGAADARAIRTAIKRLGRVLRVLAWQTRRGAATARDDGGPRYPELTQPGKSIPPRRFSDMTMRPGNMSD